MPLDRRDFVKSLTASFALPGMTSALADASPALPPAAGRTAKVSKRNSHDLRRSGIRRSRLLWLEASDT